MVSKLKTGVLSLLVIAIIILIIILFYVDKNAPPIENTDILTNKDYYPADTWRTSTPEEQGVDSEKLYKMIKGIKDNKIPIDSLLIIRNGYIITEAYFPADSKDTLHELQSATKSFTSALVGIAVKEGYIKGIDEKVLNYFPELKVQNLDSRKKAMSLQNLLSMTAGLQWDGFYNGTYDTNSELYFSSDPVQYILDKPMTDDPGKAFLYNNGAPQLLTEIIQKASGIDLKTFAETKLFKPLGIAKYYWESSSDGTLLGYYGLNMTARDMAKFGYLFLKKGKWEGTQIVTENWIEESTKKQVDESFFSSIGYGYLWWINSFGGYLARGLHGQYIIVMPELNMVVVFQSHFTDNDLIPLYLMESSIAPAVKSAQSLPPNTKTVEMIKSISRE